MRFAIAVGAVLASLVAGSAAALGDELPLSDQPGLAVAWSADSAAALAAGSGQPVMIASSITPTGASFAMPDGSHVLESSDVPLWAPDPSSPSGWRKVDETLVDQGAVVAPVAGGAPVTLSDGGADGFLARLGLGADQAAVGWVGSLPTPQLSGSEARYVDALPGIDIVVDVRRSGFEISYVVKQRPSSPLVLPEPLALRGLSASIAADGSVTLTDTKTGQQVANAAPARMWMHRAAQTRTSLRSSRQCRCVSFRPRPGPYSRSPRIRRSLTSPG